MKIDFTLYSLIERNLVKTEDLHNHDSSLNKHTNKTKPTQIFKKY